MNNPLVSVIIATYRREADLLRALESLKTQTYSDLEVLVVDDNADKCWNEKVAAVTAKAAPWFSHGCRHLVNEVNCGSAETRNIGIRAAAGAYIAFLDDDDVYLPEKIEAQVTRMLQTDADYCITDLELYDEQERLAERRTRAYLTDFAPEFLLRCHLMYHMTGTDTLMFRTAYLRAIGGFPPIDIGDEFYLMTEAISAGGKLTYLPRCDVKAYIHNADGGLSTGEKKIAGENALHQFKQRYFDRLDGAARRYICMRHYAVLAFVGLQQRNPVMILKNGVRSFCMDPLGCCRLLLTRK